MSNGCPRNVSPNEAPRVEPLALRPRDAARALAISERTLWTITTDQASGIPHVRIGRAVVYPIRELRRWLAAQAGKGGVR